MLCLAITTGKGAPDFTEAINDVSAVYGMMKDCIGRAFPTQPE
ncbi:MAG: hypothetical protein VB091_06595 [Christensenella sp.]|nr:hypothetical protein [Christensenella sp.]